MTRDVMLPEPGTRLTYDQARPLLAVSDLYADDGETVEERVVHTFLGGPLGADWNLDDVETAMREASEIVVTGGLVRAMGHGLAVPHKTSSDRETTLFLATTAS